MTVLQQHKDYYTHHLKLQFFILYWKWDAIWQHGCVPLHDQDRKTNKTPSDDLPLIISSVSWHCSRQLIHLMKRVGRETLIFIQRHNCENSLLFSIVRVNSKYRPHRTVASAAAPPRRLLSPPPSSTLQAAAIAALVYHCLISWSDFGRVSTTPADPAWPHGCRPPAVEV